MADMWGDRRAIRSRIIGTRFTDEQHEAILREVADVNRGRPTYSPLTTSKWISELVLAHLEQRKRARKRPAGRKKV